MPKSRMSPFIPVMWLAVLWGFVFLLRRDIALMQWRFDVFPKGPGGLFKQIVLGFRDFGQMLPFVVVLIVVATYDRRRRTIITTVLLAQLLAAFVYNPAKVCISRYRPQEAIEKVGELSSMTVDDTWLGWQGGDGGNGTQSFPSGHSAAAFAFAGCLAWFYPRIGWLLWTLAAGCALSRYIDGVHWLSDCLAGATVGYMSAWMVLHRYLWTTPFRFCKKLLKRKPACQ